MKMAMEPKAISVDPKSEFARWLDDAARSPVLFEMSGRIFRLSAEPLRQEATPDVPANVAAMHAATETWGKPGLGGFRSRVSRAREEGTESEPR